MFKAKHLQHLVFRYKNINLLLADIGHVKSKNRNNLATHVGNQPCTKMTLGTLTLILWRFSKYLSAIIQPCYPIVLLSL